MNKERIQADMRDERVRLANRCAQLLWDKHNGLESSTIIDEAEKLFNEMDNCVRNFYELEDNIPLFRLSKLYTLGMDNWGYTEEEYQDELDIATEKCDKFYN